MGFRQLKNSANLWISIERTPGNTQVLSLSPRKPLTPSGQIPSLTVKQYKQNISPISNLSQVTSFPQVQKYFKKTPILRIPPVSPKPHKVKRIKRVKIIQTTPRMIVKNRQAQKKPIRSKTSFTRRKRCNSSEKQEDNNAQPLENTNFELSPWELEPSSTIPSANKINIRSFLAER